MPEKHKTKNGKKQLETVKLVGRLWISLSISSKTAPLRAGLRKERLRLQKGRSLLENPDQILE